MKASSALHSSGVSSWTHINTVGLSTMCTGSILNTFINISIGEAEPCSSISSHLPLPTQLHLILAHTHSSQRTSMEIRARSCRHALAFSQFYNAWFSITLVRVRLLPVSGLGALFPITLSDCFPLVTSGS